MTTTPVIHNTTIQLADLGSHPSNYRTHPESQIQDLMASLLRFGQVKSIVIQEGPHPLCVAGHGIVEAARRLNYSALRADVIPADWSPADVKGYLIADNQHAANALDDEAQLAALLQEQREAGFDLSALGTDEDDLQAILDRLEDEGEGGYTEGAGGDDFDTTPPAEPVAKLGDIWQLGKHRLLVGDSTNLGNIEMLMQGEKAILVVTSPPYWVGKEYEQEHGKEEIIAHIELSASSIVSIMSSLAHIAINTGTTTETKQGGGVRKVWLLLDWWANAFEKHNWYMRNVRIWAKHGGFTSFSPQQDVADQNWEFLASFTREKPKHQNKVGERWALDGVWDCQPQTSNVDHSAPFPVEIPSRYIALYTDKNDVVFEPYCGSGTTLIACERLDRKCRSLELAPKYADVTIRRWEAETGGTASLLTRLEVSV